MEASPTSKARLPDPASIRITSIPGTWKLEDFVNALRLADDSLHNWEVPLDQIFMFPSYNSSNTQVAILTLRDCPEFFKNDQIATREKMYLWTSMYSHEARDVLLFADSHFKGLTPLNAPADGDDINTELDVIAVNGLAGHPIESWRSQDTGRMWLFDFLPKEFKNIRVFTYGENTSIVENDSFSTMTEYRRFLMNEIENVRVKEYQNRPLVLIGHNMGGIVILSLLLEAKGNQFTRHIPEAVAGVFFFGTPHHGMYVEDYLEVLEDQSAEPPALHEVVTQLKEGSTFLRSQHEDIKNLWPWTGEPRPLIVNFYETQTTPRLVKSAEGWVAAGEKVQRVPSDSSNLFWDELRVPVKADNNNMVKFATESDQTYDMVVRLLKQVLKEQKTRPHAAKMEGL